MFRPSLFWTAEERGQRGEGPSARFRFSERMTSNTMSLLEITGLTHAFGGQPLFQNAAFALHRGEHVGVVGRNGAGKSTLLKLCTGQAVPDGGRIVCRAVSGWAAWTSMPPGTRSTAMGDGAARGPSGALYALERAMTELYGPGGGGPTGRPGRRGPAAGGAGGPWVLRGGHRVEKAAAGLGLAELGLDRPVGELSGGQRAKLLLARLLLEEPDVLLLDEPTNFLDQEQAAWLADTLTGLERAFLAVSHDAAFLNRAVTAVCAVEGRRLTKYPGELAAAYQAQKGVPGGGAPPAVYRPASGRSRGRRPISAKTGRAATRRWPGGGRRGWTVWSGWRRRRAGAPRRCSSSSRCPRAGRETWRWWDCR